MKLNIKWALLSTTLASFFALVIAYLLSLGMPIYEQPVLGAFPIYENVIEFMSLVLGALLGVVSTEKIAGKDLYDDLEVVLGISILGILGVFTVGLVVPPFNIQPIELAIGATAFLELGIMQIFAIALSKVI